MRNAFANTEGDYQRESRTGLETMVPLPAKQENAEKENREDRAPPCIYPCTFHSYKKSASVAVATFRPSLRMARFSADRTLSLDLRVPPEAPWAPLPPRGCPDPSESFPSTKDYTKLTLSYHRVKDPVSKIILPLQRPIGHAMPPNRPRRIRVFLI